jgi:hypothetical protein
MGYANNSHTYYRHYMESPNGTYIFTVTPLMGNPVIMLGINSTAPLRPTLNNFNTYTFIATMPTNKQNN